MAQLVVRDLEDAVKAALKRRAKRMGRSMEEEIRTILRDAAREPLRPTTGLGSRIAGLFDGIGLGTELPELGGQRARGVDLD